MTQSKVPNPKPLLIALRNLIDLAAVYRLKPVEFQKKVAEIDQLVNNITGPNQTNIQNAWHARKSMSYLPALEQCEKGKPEKMQELISGVILEVENRFNPNKSKKNKITQASIPHKKLLEASTPKERAQLASSSRYFNKQLQGPIMANALITRLEKGTFDPKQMPKSAMVKALLAKTDFKDHKGNSFKDVTAWQYFCWQGTAYCLKQLKDLIASVPDPKGHLKASILKQETELKTHGMLIEKKFTPGYQRAPSSAWFQGILYQLENMEKGLKDWISNDKDKKAASQSKEAILNAISSLQECIALLWGEDKETMIKYWPGQENKIKAALTEYKDHGDKAKLESIIPIIRESAEYVQKLSGITDEPAPSPS